jgi:hypothetical protein
MPVLEDYLSTIVRINIVDRYQIMSFEHWSKNKKPHSLTMDGVLDALKHSYLLCVRKWGDDLYPAIFYLTVFLYKNNNLSVKIKIEKYIKNIMLC